MYGILTTYILFVFIIIMYSPLGFEKTYIYIYINNNPSCCFYHEGLLLYFFLNRDFYMSTLVTKIEI
jgi:hypothetical protein